MNLISKTFLLRTNWLLKIRRDFIFPKAKNIPTTHKQRRLSQILCFAQLFVYKDWDWRPGLLFMVLRGFLPNISSYYITSADFSKQGFFLESSLFMLPLVVDFFINSQFYVLLFPLSPCHDNYYWFLCVVLFVVVQLSKEEAD